MLNLIDLIQRLGVGQQGTPGGLAQNSISQSSALTRSGVTGPSAGLALEKQGETSNDAIMNLVNAMQGRTDTEVGKAIDTEKI